MAIKERDVVLVSTNEGNDTIKPVLDLIDKARG